MLIRKHIASRRLWGRYLAPERDLAALFGVSRQTIRTSLDVLEREGLVLRKGRQGTLVLPNHEPASAASVGRVIVAGFQEALRGMYSNEIVAGLTHAACEVDWSLSFSNLAVPSGRQEFFSALERGDLAGLLMVSISDQRLAEQVLRLWNGPTVVVDHHFPDLPITSVMDDSQGGARRAVEHLLSLGHTRIGYVDASRPDINPWRRAGYVEGLQAAGIEPDEDLVARAFASFQAGLIAGEELLDRRDPPTAVLVFDDVRAWGVWRAAEARGREVGADFALAGFGDTAVKAGFPDDLTSVRFDAAAMGQLAFQKLGELVSGTAKAGERLLVPTTLMVRRSSANAQVASSRDETA